jgi:hypothetical protein
MDMKEKLVGLFYDNNVRCDQKIEGLVDDVMDIIAHGVTVQEGKPLEAFPHPIDAYKGLKAKYLVFKADTGESVDNCFILRPDKDPAAVEAIRAYASATDNETLAEDIYNWVGKGKPVQKWISVKDRLPIEEAKAYEQEWCEEYPEFIVMIERGLLPTTLYYDWENNEWFRINTAFERETYKVTHWMPLPQPPKGE